MYSFTETQYASWQMRLGKRKLLRALVIFFGIYSVLYFFVVAALLLYLREYKVIVYAGIAFFLARVVLTELIVRLFKRQRPYQLFKFEPIKFSWLLSFKSDAPASFPSGHAVGMAAISAVLYVYDFRLGIVGFAMTLLAGLSRVVMGYHYPSDILFGFVLGILSGLAVLAF